MERNVNYDAVIGYAWCRSSYTAVRSLGKMGLRVAVADTTRLGMGRLLGDVVIPLTHYENLSLANDKFKERIAFLVRRIKPEV